MQVGSTIELQRGGIRQRRGRARLQPCRNLRESWGL